MQYRAMLVDDERLARTQLRTQLGHFPQVQVVAEADSADTALQGIRQFKPDLVFLDIQMPGQSGFDFLERASAKFRVIFVTAFDQFALRAFEVNALDYLLKPVGLDRLQKAIGRLAAPEPGSLPCHPPLDYSDYLFVPREPARFSSRFAVEAGCTARPTRCCCTTHRILSLSAAVSRPEEPASLKRFPLTFYRCGR